MKEYKISYFRLSLVLLGYLIYNLVYYMLDYSGGYAFFIVWPIFFLSLAMIVLGNILLFRDIVKLRATYEKNKMIQVTSMIQVISASIGLCFQLTNLSAGILWPINYVEHYPLLVGTSIIYSVIFIIGVIQKRAIEQQEKLSSVFSLVFGFSVVLLCNFLLFTNSKASVFDSNKLYVEEFKDFGFTGKVEVREKTQLIEPYVGSRTSLHYDEKLSDGSYFWELIDVVEVRSGTHVTKLDDQLVEEISKYLETDEENELFDKVKKQEFQFVLFLYKDLIRKRNIDTELIDKVNNAVGFKLVEKYGLSLYPKNPPEFYSLIIKNALKNRANGDTEVAGFYNIDVLNKAMIAHFGYVNYLEFDQFLKDKNASRVDYLKKILSEIPSGTLEDGTYKFTGTTKVDGKDQLVTVTMVIENGSSHFEPDEMRNP
ncbi:hypothetical protein HMPREF3103_07790 [Granulicatella sp. HMSC30F09]|uniref:hypothetical protein n=1 Tax=Granulicatella sp. HMSC30F09 TaxID=1581071 RepID=UPI0008A584B9|nr:hypothetical protein [Granulicatella sp. HMSC30F09]OFT78782.1 hypothetical protein HMPREF3103_07790 [Granulicatella sp. HMSC30F09]